MTPSTRIPPAGASRYVPPQRPETPSPDAWEGEGLAEDASPLRDRKAIVTQTDEGLASRKRKREDHSPQQDATRARHTQGDWESVSVALPIEGEGEPVVAQSSALPLTNATPTAPVTAPVMAAATTLTEPEPTVEANTQVQVPAQIELDRPSNEPPAFMHGEYVSVYAGAATGLGALLYEEAVLTENNGTIAISTEVDRGVFAEGIAADLGVIVSSPTGVGFMTVPSARMTDVQNLFQAAQSEFIDRTGSNEDIRIRVAHNPSAYRRQLEHVVSTMAVDALPGSAQAIRTLLELPLESTDSQVREATVAHICARHTQVLEAIAHRWGVVDPLVVLPHGALHISRDALDLFQAPPDFTLPDNLNEIQNRQD